MDAPEAPKVLLLVGDARAAARARDALAQAAAVWSSPALVPPGEQVDVVVTDLAAAGPLPVPYRLRENEDLDTREWGLVILGDGAGADIALPVDFTPRELAQACRLVYQVARLRRQCNELARVHIEVTRLAETDPLTELPNRRVWEQTLLAMRSHAARERRPLWLAIADLDRFKAVNDEQGMARGDAVLARAGAALAGAVRRGDLVARLGGDEFGVLLSGVPEANVGLVLGRLLAAVSQTDEVTASIGYVAAGDPALGTAALFAVAESAMRAAKKAGGNCAVRGGATA